MAFKTIAALAALVVAAPAMAHAQAFPAPSSYQSNTVGPYTYHFGDGWSGQTTHLGHYDTTRFSSPDGSLHTCTTRHLGSNISNTICN
jgi:hypothetical protein